MYRVATATRTLLPSQKTGVRGRGVLGKRDSLDSTTGSHCNSLRVCTCPRRTRVVTAGVPQERCVEDRGRAAATTKQVADARMEEEQKEQQDRREQGERIRRAEEAR
jgi:hypothetical protein